MSITMHDIPYENLKGVNAPYTDAFEKRFHALLGSGWYILGKEVQQFEQAFADYHEMPHAIGVASGLDALVLSLMALELPPQSEVIVAANAYVACILSILQARCKPVLVEPSAVDGNIDVAQIEAMITPKTKVIMPVHLYGNPCDMSAIVQLAEKYQLSIIEDCAQAHGATFNGQKVGTFSTLSAFSFYPTKNLGALGDAGAVLTRDPVLAEKVRALRNYGSKTKYYNDYIGLNSRLDEVQAGFLSIKLPHLEATNAHKRALAVIYDELLHPDYQRIQIDPRAKSVYHIYPVFFNKRDALKQALKEKGIGSEIHYPVPPHQQKALSHLFQGVSYPVSERLHQTTLSLPISTIHTPEDIKWVCQIMNQLLDQFKEHA